MKRQTITMFLAVVISTLILGCGSSANNKQQPSANKSAQTQTTKTKELGDIQLTAKIENIGGGKVKVSGTTNLPDGYNLMIQLSNKEDYMVNVMKLPPNSDKERKLSHKQFTELEKNSYNGSSKKYVKDGKYEVTFSGETLKLLRPDYN